MDWPTKAVDWAIIFGTLFTGLLALYAYCGEWLRKWWNSPRLILEIESCEKNSFIFNGERTNRFYPLRVCNEKGATEAKRVRVRLLAYYKREDDKSPFKEIVLPAPLPFGWGAAKDAEYNTTADFTSYDSFILGYVEEGIGAFRLKTTPDILQFTGAVLRGQSIIVKIEISAENTRKHREFFLNISMPKRDGGTSNGYEPLNLAGPFAVPFINKISEREFKQLTK